jgi:hypothetical protein
MTWLQRYLRQGIHFSKQLQENPATRLHSSVRQWTPVVLLYEELF